MRGSEVQADKKRFVFIRSDEVQYMISENVTSIAQYLFHLSVQCFDTGVFGRATPNPDSGKFVIAKFGRVLMVLDSKMPFAEKSGRIAGLLEKLWKR